MDYVTEMLAKAASAQDSADSMRYTQAAVNAANAICAGSPMPGRSPADIDRLVNRFLAWELPKDFNPDGGIVFEPVANAGTIHEYVRRPIGTNLLNASQAKAMIAYILTID